MRILATFEKELKKASEEIQEALVTATHISMYDVGRLQGRLNGIREAQDILSAILAVDEERQRNL